MESAYCMKCRIKREYKEEPVYKEKQTSRGVKGLLQGRCAVCDTTMVKIVKPRQKADGSDNPLLENEATPGLAEEESSSAGPGVVPSSEGGDDESEEKKGWKLW